ncbi:MAG: KH domain-containing protein [bacterium]
MDDELYSTVKFLVKCLVDNPDLAEVDSEVSGKKAKFIIKVPDNEMGKVLGQGGHTINAVRAIASTLGRKVGRFKIQIVVESI